MNFGGFATPERHVIFDINDFDETQPAPWEWDVKRLAASFVIAARPIGLSDRVGRGRAECARSYREHVRELSQLDPLASLVLERDGRGGHRPRPRRAESHSEASRQGHDANGSELDFPKLGERRERQDRIREQPPLMYHPEGGQGSGVPGELDQIFVPTARRWPTTGAPARSLSARGHGHQGGR